MTWVPAAADTRSWYSVLNAAAAAAVDCWMQPLLMMTTMSLVAAMKTGSPAVQLQTKQV